VKLIVKRMRQIIIVIVFVIVLVSCSSKSGAQEQSELVQNTIATLDTIVIQDDDEFEEVVVFPQKADLPLFLLSTGVYHNEEVAPDDVNKGWFGLFLDRGNYYLAPTSISINKAFDAVLDDDENNSSTWTGWSVSTVNIDTSLVLIGGFPKLKEGKVQAVTLEEYTQAPAPNKNMTFVFDGTTYKFSAEGDVVPAEYNPQEYIVKNYKLYLQGNKNGKEINQLLGSASFFEDNTFEVLFIGDIDGDNIPDLLLNTSYHYNLYRPTLYLSSFANENELVKVVAIHESVGC
jgi:hypothetical protein